MTIPMSERCDGCTNTGTHFSRATGKPECDLCEIASNPDRETLDFVLGFEALRVAADAVSCLLIDESLWSHSEEGFVDIDELLRTIATATKLLYRQPHESVVAKARSELLRIRGAE